MKCAICKEEKATGKYLKDLCKECEEYTIFDWNSARMFVSSNKKLEKQYEKWLEKELDE